MNKPAESSSLADDPRDSVDLTEVAAIIDRCGSAPDRSIPILQAIQCHYRYLPPAAIRRASELTGIPLATLAGVASFYAQFRQHPMGRHHIKVCDGTACHVHGADAIHDALRNHLHLQPDQDTDAAGNCTIEKVFCIGCCSLAPVVQIDEVSYSHLTSGSATLLLESLEQQSPPPRKQRKPRPLPSRGDPALQPEIRICLDSCCLARGCAGTRDALEEAIADGRLDARLKRVACGLMCTRTPMLELATPGAQATCFVNVEAEQAVRALQASLHPRSWTARLRWHGERAVDWLAARWAMAAEPKELPLAQSAPNADERAYFSGQVHLATEHFGQLDPLDLGDYLAHDGFAALRRCLDRTTPIDVLGMIERSGLRGRGGAGYPTARKWRIVRDVPAAEKWIICNGDEGDPGAFMDRMLMESFPYRILEGMLIAAIAVGAQRGTLYVRAEYPAAVVRLRDAIDHCRNANLLGDNILGSGYSMEINVFEGAGAFVCGEETAMLESMEGRRGIPRLKPPYPAQSGYHGLPTLINNVETFASVPWIVRNGPDAFAAIGSGASKGTKVFALAGKIRRGGLIEVPMGIPLRQIVESIGGGTPDGSPFKAVLMGGPSGGCIPYSMADTPVDYESLAAMGSIMGSGGMIVLDHSDCMVQMARYFLTFCQCESCGKCTFCRIGTRRMLDILNALCRGQANAKALDELDNLATAVCRASLCGLGRTAPNPVLSAMRHFRHEFEAHLDGRCPAGCCKDLIRYEVTGACIGCTLCAQHCPSAAITSAPYQRHQIVADLCTRCDACRQVCPEHAISVH